MANEDLSYLSFLDDTQSQGRSDLSYLSFLNEPEVSDKKTSQGFQGSGRYPKSLEGPQPRQRTIADSFQGAAPFPEELAGPQRPKPIPEPTEPIQDYPRPKEKKNIRKELNKFFESLTPEQLMNYAKGVGEDLYKGHLQLSKGFASGATLTGSTYIDAFKPEEQDFLYGVGEAIGSTVPAYLIGSMYSAPLLAMVAKFPKYAAALQSLARMTGMGLTGATIKGGREIIQGEVPDPKELAKEGALWAAFDAGLQTLGLANEFRQSINRIAEQQGISNKQVLSNLWKATKNYTKQKFNRIIGRPETIRPDDIQTMARIADQTAKQPGEIIDITPEPPPKPKQLTQPPAKPELEQLPEKAKREPRPAKVTETPAVIEAEAPKPKAEPKIKEGKPKQDKTAYNEDYLINKFDVRKADWKNTSLEGLIDFRHGIETKIEQLKNSKYDKSEEIATLQKSYDDVTKAYTDFWESAYRTMDTYWTDTNKKSKELYEVAANLPENMNLASTVAKAIKDYVNVTGEFPYAYKDVPDALIYYIKMGDAGDSKYEKDIKKKKDRIEQSKKAEESLRNKWELYKKVLQNPKQDIPEAAQKPVEKPKAEPKPEAKPSKPISSPPIAEGAKKAQRNDISPKEQELPDLSKPKAQPEEKPKPKAEAKPKPAKPEKKPKTAKAPKAKPEETPEPVYVPWTHPPEYLISNDNLKISKSAPEGKTKTFTVLTFTGPQNNPERLYIKKTGLVYDNIFALYEDGGRYILEHLPSRSELSSVLADFKTLDQAKDYLPYLYKAILPGVDATKPARSARFDIFDGYFLDDVRNKILKGQPLPSLENIEPKPFEHYYEEGEPADEFGDYDDDFDEKPKKAKKPAKKGKPKKSGDTLASRLSTRERQPKMGKRQTIAKQKMIQRLREIFKDPIRIGKIRQRNALGIHKLWSKVSRLLYHNDVETAAHEIGHNLHGILYGGKAKNVKQFRSNAINALKPYLGELKPIAKDEPHELEGFAEFVRMYVTNPETIKALAPKFYNVFEAEMQAREPDLLKGLLEIRGYYDDWINASPEARVEAQIDYDKEPVTERVKRLYNSGLVDKAVQHFVDEYRPAQRVEALIYNLPIHEIEELSKPSLYRALRLLKNSPLNIDQFLYHGTFDPISKKTTGEPLTNILQEIKTNRDWRDFNNYLTSQRVLELAERGIDKGVRIADALATVKKHAKYEKLAKRFRAWIDRTLDYAVKSQLVKPEAAEAMRKAGLFYVPLQVEKPGSKAFAGLKKLQAKVPFFRIKGSKRRIVPPVEGAIKNLYQIVTNADKNRVGLVLSKLAEEKGAGLYIEKVPAPMKMVGMVKTPEIEAAIIKHLVETGNTEFLIETDGKYSLDPAISDILPETIMRFRPGSYRNDENIITVFEQGKPQYYEVVPELYEMWSGVMDPRSAHFLLKMISPATKLKRMSATLNIPFAINNLIRDSWERLMYSRFPPNPRDIRDVAEHIFLPIYMLWEAAGQGELYQKYIRSGGGLSTLVSLDKGSLQTAAKEVRKGRHITLRKLFNPKFVAHLVRRMVEIGEEANKLAEFYRGLKVYGDTVLGRERAAFAARDLSIDHNRAGITGRGINQVTAFFNAGAQGGNKFYRRLRDPKTRAKTLFGMLAYVSIPSALAYLTVYDDDDYKELSASERDRNLIFRVGGKLYKVPVPFEPGIIANGMMRRSLEWMRTHDPEAFRGFAHSLFEGMLPPMLPDVAHAPLEIAANRDFFRDTPIIPKAKEGLLAREQYKESTSLTARLLGRWLSYLPGVDAQSRVASPAMIDHLILSYATRWGQVGLSILDKVVEASGAIDPGARPSRPITDQMGLNVFAIRYPRANTQSIQDFYQTYAEIQALRKTQKFYKGEGREEDADEMKKALEDKGNPKRFDIGYKALQRQQAMINRTYQDKTIPDDEKQSLIDEMYLERIAIARELVKEMKDWQRQEKQKD